MISSVFDSIIAMYSNQFGVPESWTRAVILTESSGDPNAFRSTSPRDTSYGLMQLTLPTAQALGFIGDPTLLFDPDTNIRLGTKLLGQLRSRYGDDASAVYSAYNSGNGTNYLTNPTVATHVEHFINNLTSVITNNPLVATSGSVGALIIFALIWYWTKRKGK
jgi:soluble lytic murein transglycosylase-like protein